MARLFFSVHTTKSLFQNFLIHILAPDSTLNEWDFSLPIGSRPNGGFVGLKNGGATCYMNSVLQQLFMIRSIRTAILSVKIPAEYGEDELDEDDVRRDTVCKMISKEKEKSFF